LIKRRRYRVRLSELEGKVPSLAFLDEKSIARLAGLEKRYHKEEKGEMQDLGLIKTT
jgi:hypothetical protein